MTSFGESLINAFTRLNSKADISFSCVFCQNIACEHFLQDELEQANEDENRTLGRGLKDTGGSSEPEATQLTGRVDLAAHGDDVEGLLRRFSELADKYWSGPTTLLRNQQSRS